MLLSNISSPISVPKNCSHLLMCLIYLWGNFGHLWVWRRLPFLSHMVTDPVVVVSLNDTYFSNFLWGREWLQHVEGETDPQLWISVVKHTQTHTQTKRQWILNLVKPQDVSPNLQKIYRGQRNMLNLLKNGFNKIPISSIYKLHGKMKKCWWNCGLKET